MQESQSQSDALKTHFIIPSVRGEGVGFPGQMTRGCASGGSVCAGLNPLSRTIQGNDPGTTACPPSAQAGIG